MADGNVRYGLIGCGEIAVQNFDAVVAAENAELAATFDVKAELAQDLAGRVEGAVACTTQDELLARDDVDAVIISTPHFLHEPIAVAALEAGKHVLCEKPIACNVEQGQRMVDAAERTGRLLGCCFVRRYGADAEGLRSLIADGHLGTVTGWMTLGMGYKKESYWTGGYTGRATTDWRLKRATAGGGYLIMNTIHTIDFLRYATGEEMVAAKATGGTYNSPEGVEVEDLIAGVVSLSGGGIGTIVGGSAVPGGRLSETRIIGTKGQVNLGGRREGTRLYLTDGGEVMGQSVPAGEWTAVDLTGGVSGKPRALLVEGFGRWVRGGEPFRSPGADALKTLAMCEALYRDAGLVKE